MYTSFLVGNGLGLSLNSQYFSLESAVNWVWNNSKLDKNDKQRIIQLCPSKKIPTQEAELDILQKTVWSCGNVQKHENGIKWLTDDGRKLPESFDRLKHFVATYYFDYYKKNEKIFIDPDSSFKQFCLRFMNYIREDNTNIFTLNYDGLLYNEFLQDSGRSIFNGYDGRLVDGILDNGFSPANLERRHGKTFGYYLHLHGTPIVYDMPNNENMILKRKYNIAERQWENDEHICRHIVLTHERFKTGIIEESPLLRTYWEYFNKSLTETNHLVIFGYSGNDQHINKTISNHLPYDANVTVIERPNPERNEKYWNTNLAYLENGEKKDRNIKMIILPNILNWDFSLK